MNTKTSELNTKFLEFFPEGMSNIFRIFSDMEIAEDEIKKAIDLNPELSDRINSIFLCLQKDGISECFGEDLYRIHIRQIIDRVINDKPISTGTWAEMLWILQELSLRQPLKASVTYVATILFEKAYGHNISEKLGLGDNLRFEYEGEKEEILYELYKASWNKFRFEQWDKTRYKKNAIQGAK